MSSRPSAPDLEGLARFLERIPSFQGSASTFDQLRQFGEPDVLIPELRHLCASHPSPHVRFHAERVLRAAPRREPALDLSDPEALREAFASEDPGMRLAAIRHAAGLPPEEAGPLLVAALRRPEEDPWNLAGLVTFLGRVGGPDAPEEVSVLLDHPSPRVAANALEALHRLEPSTAVYAAMYRLRSEDNRLRANAVLAIYRTQRELAWSHVRAMATSEDPWMRASGCFLAAHLEHPEAGSLLARILVGEEDPEILGRALRGLVTSGGADALPALGFWETDRNGPLREEAGRALAAVAERLGIPVGEARRRADIDREAFLAERARQQAERRESEDPLLRDLVVSLDDGGAAPEEDTLGRAGRVRARTGWTEKLRVPVQPEAEPEAPPRPPPPTPPDDTAAILEAAGEDPRRVDALVDRAVGLMKTGGYRQAVALLEPLLRDREAADAPRLHWGLAMGHLGDGEVGRGLQHLHRFDPGALDLMPLYVLARNLDEAGAVSAAIRLYENIESRHLGFRDAAARLSRLLMSGVQAPEHVWIKLAERYKDLKLVGSGGMAQVFSGRERSGDRAVAIKVPDARTMKTEKDRVRFFREVEVLSGLRHPNIIRVHEIVREGIIHFTMELLSGRTLEEFLEDRRVLRPREAMEVLQPIASALAYVHAQGIVHRDVKPSNIFLAEDGSPRLGDFGILFVGGQTNLTTTGAVLGTMRYIAPEQLVGGTPGPFADIYSFGVILYEALLGEAPFDAAAVLQKVYREAPDPAELRPDLPGPLLGLIRDCIDRDPLRRPIDGTMLVERLEALGELQ